MTSAAEETVAADGDVAPKALRLARGDLVGRYVVVGTVGAGGMGIVVQAYDPELDRRVALKFLHSSTAVQDSSEGRRRLLREAQAMARLSHPNVVAVHDVGLHEERVFLAMELVSGRTLRVWLDERPRSWREIVAVFVQAGHGLAAAHDKNLIHRDFKPDNVMVDDDPRRPSAWRVRVMDFGLARPAETPSDSAPIADDEVRPTTDALTSNLTGAGVLVGTPAYMAAELHRGREITASIDQFAFCVSLWEALFGARPFKGRSFAELAFAITEGTIEPPPPGARVPARLRKIVARGLAPTADRRWPSMTALLDALGRDPTRRRRYAFAVGVLAVASLGGLGMRELARARAREACDAESAAIAEVWNSDRAGAIGSAFAATGVAYADASWQRAWPRLDAYAQSWSTARRDACLAATVDETLALATMQRMRACFDDHRDRLDALVDRLAEPDAGVVQRSVIAVSSLPLVRACTDETWLAPDRAVYAEQGDDLSPLRRRLVDASAANLLARYDDALEEANAVIERADAVGATLLAAEARFTAGMACEHLGRYPEARTLLEDAFYTASMAGVDAVALPAAAMLTTVVGRRLAQHDHGLTWARQAAMIVERSGLKDHPDAALAAVALGNLHYVRGAHAEARVAYEHGLALREALFGPEHPNVALSLLNVGVLSAAESDHARALEVTQRALSIMETTLGPDHPDVASAHNNIGLVHGTLGRQELAIASFRRALAIREKVLRPDHPDVALTLFNIATALGNLKRSDESLAMFERVLSIQEKSFGPDHPELASTLVAMSSVERERGELDRALTLGRRGVELTEKGLGAEHGDVAPARLALALALAAHGDTIAAKREHERAIAIREKAFGIDDPQVAGYLIDYGKFLARTGAHQEAVPILERGLAGWERVGRAASEIAHARFSLARSLWEGNVDRARALELARQARDTFAELGPPEKLTRAEADAWLEAALRSAPP